MRMTATAIIVGALALSGCATNVSRFQMPGTSLADVETLYVNPATEGRGASTLHTLILADLRKRGLNVEAREEATVPASGEYLFDYKADWQWDVTWYLIELRVAIYDPTDDTLVAQAHSHQSSFARESIEEVVRRALAALFDDTANQEEGE